MGKLTVRLLGPPDVHLDGRPVGFRARKSLALLAYLAVADGPRSREEIVALLWPGSGGDRGRASLRSALAGLRGALGEAAASQGGDHLLVDGDALGLMPGPDLEVDLQALDSAHVLARSTPRTEDLAADARRVTISRLRFAAEAYRGDFLNGFSLEGTADFDLWLDMERQAWRGRLGLVYDRLSRLLLENGEPEVAIAAAATWTERMPLAEEAHRRLMEAQLAAGDVSGALNTYDTFRSFVKRELGTAPKPQTEALARRAAEGPPIRPPLRTPLPASHTKPPSEDGRALIDTPFVNRAEEFDALVDAYRSADSGETRTVALVGDAGIGKTRLAEEFFSWAEAQGADVLRGRVHTVGGLPYGVFVEALRSRVERERAPDDLVEDVWLSELARLLPEIRDRYPDLPPPESDESRARAGLLESISRVVAAFASKSSAPVVLFLDDLHWATRDSQDALKYAARRWSEDGARVLIVLGLRLEVTETLPSSTRWLSELGRELPVRCLELEPLAPRDTLDLLRALLGKGLGEEASGEEDGTTVEEASGVGLERLGRWLHEETGGQPLFLAETLKLLSGKGVLTMRTGSTDAPHVTLGPAAHHLDALRGVLPESVREAILARLARLSEAGRKFLAAGAVLSPEFTFELALEVAEMGEDEGLEALDEVLASRLVEEARHAQRALGEEVDYTFAHDKIREVIYTEAGAARRRVFHRRALETLEAGRDIQPAELARHALVAGLPEEVFRHSIAAGDAAMGVFAARDAADHYERVRRLTEDGVLPVVPPALGGLYAKLGRAYELSEEWEEARDVYESLLTRAREIWEPALECAALNLLAILAAKRSFESHAAKGLLEQALRIAERAGDRVGLANTEWNLAETAVRASDPRVALQHGERALTLARELSLTELTARSLHALAMIGGHVGDWEMVVVQTEESRKLYAAMREEASNTEDPTAVSFLVGSPPLNVLGHRAMEGENLSLRSVGQAHLGRPREGVDAARAALEISAETNNPWLNANASVGLALGLKESGEYEEALLAAKRGVVQARAIGTPYIPLMLFALGYAHEAVFSLDSAQESYQEALERSEILGKLYTLVSTSNLCAARVLAGDWEAAHARALEAATLRGEVFTRLCHADRVCHLETEALLRGGDERLAREGVRRFGRSVGCNRRYRVAYLRSLAVVARWDADTSAAVGHLREAEALAEEIGLPGELWQIAAGLGELYVERGERKEARAASERSARTLRWLADKVEDDSLRTGFLAAPQVQRVLGSVHASGGVGTTLTTNHPKRF